MMGAAAKQREGLTENARRALRLFATATASAYGSRLAQLVVFGSRARGDAQGDSDLDVAVIMADPIPDWFHEKMTLADLAYDAIVETGVHVQAWPLSQSEWDHPESHVNPALVRAMKRDQKRASA